METCQKTCDNRPRNLNNIARKRWSILGNALRNKKSRPLDNDASKRRFQSFDILSREELDSTWTNYSYKVNGVNHSAQFCQLPQNTKPTTLCGFNNTGNVCIWPSEEILAKYCLDCQKNFQGKNVCELGGGMTCLAGVLLATSKEPRSVYLTDGNEESVKNIDNIVMQNKDNFLCPKVKSGVLRWDQKESFPSTKFDFIIISDCLFFEEFHESLVNCLAQLLESQGRCIIIAPNRGETYAKFLKLATVDDIFTLKLSSDNYDSNLSDLEEKIKKQPEINYDPDIHYPRLHILEKQ